MLTNLIPHHYQRYLNFAFSGLLGFASEYLLLSILHYGVGQDLIFSKLFGYCGGILTTYVYNRLITFGSSNARAKTREFILYVFGALLGATINNLAFFTLVYSTPITTKFTDPYGVLLSMALSTGLSMVFNYLFYRHYVFVENDGKK